MSDRRPLSGPWHLAVLVVGAVHVVLVIAITGALTILYALFSVYEIDPGDRVSIGVAVGVVVVGSSWAGAIIALTALTLDGRRVPAVGLAAITGLVDLVIALRMMRSIPWEVLAALGLLVVFVLILLGMRALGRDLDA